MGLVHVITFKETSFRFCILAHAHPSSLDRDGRKSFSLSVLYNSLFSVIPHNDESTFLGHKIL